MPKVKLAIIGLGLAWERLHAPALARLQDRFEIVAVCDIDAQKAQNVAQSLGLPQSSAFTDYHEMLNRSDIEAVEALLPIQENYECAEAIINAGKHVIAEKPFAATPEAARRLIDLKNKMKVKILVAENIRYEEENTLIKKLIDEGAIGNVIYFIDNHITEYAQDAENGGFAQTNWRQHPQFEGGVLLDSGVHHMARLRYLFGDINSLYATGRPSTVGFAPYSCVNALIGFREYIHGHYSFLTVAKETQYPLVGLRIFGTHGEIYLEERTCGFVNITYKDGRPGEAIPYNVGQGYFHELEDFHTALRLGNKIESTPEKAMGDIETVFAILESCRTGEVIKPIQEVLYSGVYSRTKVVIPAATQLQALIT